MWIKVQPGLRFDRIIPFSYKNEYGNYDIIAVHPEYGHFESLEIIKGRFLNKTDINEYRKVASIGRLVEDAENKLHHPFLLNKILNFVQRNYLKPI